MTIGTPHEALAVAIERCAMHGTHWRILNSDRETVWDVEPDTKADEDDLTYPVIVHMRGGSLLDWSIAILVENEMAS